ncbi:LamG domain-containing protein, partial [Planctomycetota bacterium]
MSAIKTMSISLLFCVLFTAGALADNTNYCQVAGSACLDFDGTDDYVDLGNSTDLALTSGDMTVMAWLRMASGNAGKLMGITGKLTNGSPRGFALMRGNTNEFNFLRANGSYTYKLNYSTPGYTDTEWHHVAATMQGSASSIYVDGVKLFSNAGGSAFVNSTDIAYVGRLYSNHSSRYFDGMIDDVRFYDRHMSTSDIGTAMISLPGLEIDLMGYWNFNEGAGQVAADHSGHTNHGQLGSSGGADSADPTWTDTGVFCGSPATQVISGFIQTSGSSPVAGVTVVANNGGGSGVTNASGYYSLSVPNNWSGQVIPSLGGYVFSPSQRSYVNVTSSQNNQNYTASAVSPPTQVISGYVRTSGSVGVAGVSVVANNGGGSTTTNSQGFYLLNVPNNWSGQVIPSLGGYVFSPSQRSYVNVTSSQNNQNYTASAVSPPTQVISGYVRTSGSVGVPGVSVVANNGGGSTATNSQGFYLLNVPHNWSGQVIPALGGYVFSPSQRSYVNVTSSQNNQNYTVSAVPPPSQVISGYVRTSGSVGVAGVSVAANNGGGSTTTNSQGFYVLNVPHNWSGQVAPSLGGYVFSPSQRSYVNVTSSQNNQNYTVSAVPPPTQVISGYVRTSGGVGVTGVSVVANNGGGSTTTNSLGYYSLSVPYNWSGQVTPSLGGYVFSPSYHSYSNVTSARTNQNYTASVLPPASPVISGTIRNNLS